MIGNKTLMGIAFVCGATVATVAFAATEKTITQKDKVFSESEVTLKVGDSLVFVNDDTIAHNALSMSPGNQFNLGSMKPGTSTPVTFKNAGDVQIICAMHPSMRMKVKVTD
jgi:plastocyanin